MRGAVIVLLVVCACVAWMKIDAWTHMLSPSYLRQLEGSGREAPGAGRFLLEQRALYDIEFRLRLMYGYGDYRQILTPVPAPHW